MARAYDIARLHLLLPPFAVMLAIPITPNVATSSAAPTAYVYVYVYDATPDNSGAMFRADTADLRSEAPSASAAPQPVGAVSFAPVDSVAVDTGAEEGSSVIKGCTVGGGSFSPDTQVVMANGTTRPLDKVKAGDKVEATNPKTGETAAQTVTAVWVNHDTDLMDVTVVRGGKSAVVHATQKHLFWVPAKRTWVEVDQLTAGEALRSNDGNIATVSGTMIVSGAADMWDLTVETNHDFFIAAATTTVLVHNQGGMSGCSDAAYQGVLHTRQEIAHEGAGGSHSWASSMSDDQLADYYDGYVQRGGGQALKGGAVGWYGTDRCITVTQRGSHSMTGCSTSYQSFLNKLAP